VRWLLTVGVAGVAAGLLIAGFFSWPYVDDFLSPVKTCDEQQETLVFRSIAAYKAREAREDLMFRWQDINASADDWEKSKLAYCKVAAISSLTARSFDRAMDRYYRQCNPKKQERLQLQKEALFWARYPSFSTDHSYELEKESTCSRWPW